MVLGSEEESKDLDENRETQTQDRTQQTQKVLTDDSKKKM
mgnify:CR=1 FL=1